MTAVSVTFGRHVRRLRLERGWSSREAGSKCGVSSVTILRAEAGYGPRLETLALIADGFGVPLPSMLEPVRCERCLDVPRAWTTCRACGAEGPEAAP